MSRWPRILEGVAGADSLGAVVREEAGRWKVAHLHFRLVEVDGRFSAKR